ncbi:glycosyltransferase family 4 protein [Psychrobacter communis]|uniref:Glycosyltransferase family 4 protein n=1 Tax=Psychrobacter communis TaxID=2762238 RepID=A0ABR8RJM9_9GAMM|nr:glycosyltransferase family 4 protein [Psychrobacter communis]MBD7947945.1 glycosyltransferase family 4 protein [Psychrobacter communis]
MKVIFLEAVQSFGGARKSTLELAKRMQDIGHDVLIVDFWGCVDSFINKIHDYNLQYIILDKRDSPILISDPNKVKKVKNTISYSTHQLKYRAKFKKIVDEFQPDIVCVNNIKCLTILQPNSSYKIDYFVRGWFEGHKLTSKTRFLLKAYQPRFLTVSQSTRQAVYTSGLAKLKNIKVLHSVISDKVFKSYEPSYTKFSKENPIRILHSGGFLPSKGQHIALEIAKKLEEKSISYKLTLTGIIYSGTASKKYYEHIISLIRQYQLQENVEIVLNKSDIIDYFKSCDILIHPSETEGLPRVALESFSFGKPVIANPVGGVTDVVLHNFTGFITDYNDINQYVEYISSYTNNLELYILHSQNARNLIQQNYLDSHQYNLINKTYPLK